jgi:catechol 2,3-dioxygenase-like lactoylglutathione lyase family enzyme
MLGANKIIGFVPSKDLSKSIQFYEDLLGIRFVKEDGFAAVFEAGDRMLRIVNVGQVPDFRTQSFAILGWEVDDMSKTVAALKERGISFEIYPWIQQDELGIWTAPNGDKIAWFKDPDGNVLSVSHHA